MHPEVPTSQNWYRNWLRRQSPNSTKSPATANGFRTARDSLDRAKQRQEYNAKLMKKTEEAQKYGMLKRMSEKQIKAEKGSAAKVKEKKEHAAVRNRRQSDFVISLQHKK